MLNYLQRHSSSAEEIWAKITKIGLKMIEQDENEGKVEREKINKYTLGPICIGIFILK